MKKITIILALSMLCILGKAADLVLPIDYKTIFADSATNADGLTLERNLGIGHWMKGGSSGSSTTNPLIQASTLSYSNYVDNLLGKEIIYTPLTSNTTRYSGFVMSSTATLTGTFYASALVNLTFVPATGYPIFSFDKFALASPRARVFVMAGSTETTFRVAMSTDALSTVSEYSSTEYEFGKTYLMVIKYVMTTSTQDAYLFINPSLDGTEPAPTVTALQSTVANGGGVKCFEVMQQVELEGKIAGIRVGRNWSDVAKGGGISKISDISSNKNIIVVTGKNLSVSEIGAFDVYSLQGSHLLSMQNTNRVETNLSSGVYIVKFKNQAGELSTQKVIIH